MKSKIKIKLSLLVFTLMGLFLTTSCLSQTKQTPPNIIVFLVDDMGLMDTSLPFLTDEKGNPKKYALNDYYRTPNMEKLAKQGVRFSNFYAHSVCSPTRSSILTGQNSARHGVTNWIKGDRNNKGKFGPSNWNWNGLTKATVTFPKLLQQAGYKTIHIGKAHFGSQNTEGEDPLNLGFDINIGGSSLGHPHSYYGKESFGLTDENKDIEMPGLEKYLGKDIFLTEALTLEANAAITQAKAEGKPFYLNMAHYAVHGPFNSDPRFADNYENSDKPKRAKAFATLIEGIDKSLGDIVKHVKDLGLGENTFIFFLGDNGSDAPLISETDYHSSEPLRGKKGNHWEGGMRVPFIASWVTANNNEPLQKKLPITPNSIQQQIGTVIDLYPTICEMANVPLPKDHVLDGFKLQDQLLGKENNSRNELFLNHYPHEHRTNYFTSLVQGDWKVIYHYPISEDIEYELFNLKSDPFETKNLAKKNPEKLKEMMLLMASEMKNKGALYPEKNGKPLELILPQ